jgi:hypothetical protein
MQAAVGLGGRMDLLGGDYAFIAQREKHFSGVPERARRAGQ